MSPEIKLGCNLKNKKNYGKEKISKHHKEYLKLYQVIPTTPQERKHAQKKTDPEVSYMFVGLSQNSKFSCFNKLRNYLNLDFEEHIIDKNPMCGIEGLKAEFLRFLAS